MKHSVLITLSIIETTLALIHVDLNWLTDNYIDSINELTRGRWTAGRNHFSNYTEENLVALADLRGYHPNSEFIAHTRRHEYIEMSSIPASFDSRHNWPQCSSIGVIRNQGLCGVSWAFVAAEVMTDRLCIATEGLVEFTFSTEELISCCFTCGNGCGGGYLYSPFEYWKYNGIPSGGDELKEELLFSTAVHELNKLTKGDLINIIVRKEVPLDINVSKSTKEVVEKRNNKYDTKYQGCKPYTAMNGNTPSCKAQCRPGYNKTLEEDVRHGVAAYHVESEELQIQIEIMKHGPVAAAMELYKDFYIYKEGIYEHITWDLVGHHAVKIIGWGEENGLPYWLLANSWGTAFGINGFVKILRGSNQCGIEYQVTAGIPNNFE